MRLVDLHARQDAKPGVESRITGGQTRHAHYCTVTYHFATKAGS